MKKIRIASLLLVLVLATSCFVGTTFAKYTTADEAADTARVAKWGVTVEANAADGVTYGFGDKYENVIDVNGKAVIGVTAEGDPDKVVAPGTQGTLATINITGKPEVAVQVLVEVDLVLEGWTVEGEDYCPIVFTVTKTGEEPVVVSGDDVATIESELEAAVIAALGTADAKYAAGTDFTETFADVQVDWAWAFQTGEDSDEKAANDIKDTVLGDAAAEGEAATIDFSYKVTVNQIDTYNS